MIRGKNQTFISLDQDNYTYMEIDVEISFIYIYIYMYNLFVCLQKYLFI